ncbi:sphingosine-1-phosphate phosphatase 1-like [Lycorma delicatula]|uniref:sphingosine-1-phosphate phosphatase 1-like n=1 Tax=Lycorma delicatula TaxID=130591 RepID=UPI003F510050
MRNRILLQSRNHILFFLNWELDVVAGLLLVLVLMIPLVPMVDSLDHILLTNKWTPLVLVIVSILLIAYYPKGKGRWTPTRGDTTLVISVCVGVIIGAWTNYQLGEMHEPSLPPPYNVIWPSYGMIGLGALRTVIGMCCIVGTRALCKSIYYAVLHYRASKTSNSNREANEEDNHNINESMTATQLEKDNVKLTIDLCSKYLTYVMIEFITLYLLPKVFRILRIERPTFYTEI